MQGDRLEPGLANRHKAVADDEDIQEILQNPGGKEAKQALTNLREYQEARFKGVRANAKAIDNDMAKTWGKISATVSQQSSTHDPHSDINTGSKSISSNQRCNVWFCVQLQGRAERYTTILWKRAHRSLSNGQVWYDRGRTRRVS